MAGSKEIRNKVKSIQSTQKITRAMEMVAASKMRKARDAMEASRPYANKIQAVIGHLVEGHLEYEHPFMSVRSVRRVGIIIVSTDRGLCGGLNANLFRTLLGQIKTWIGEGKGLMFCTLGKKAEQFFRRLQGELKASVTELGDKPQFSHLIGPVKVMLDAFENEQIDELYLASNEYKSTMSQQPRIEQLLPVYSQELALKKGKHWDYLYEPSAPELLDMLLTRYVEALVFERVVENVACEQAARMLAMKNASDNANEIIGDLQLQYNKARQAAITQELSEIVGGAAAV